MSNGIWSICLFPLDLPVKFTFNDSVYNSHGRNSPDQFRKLFKRVEYLKLRLGMTHYSVVVDTAAIIKP